MDKRFYCEYGLIIDRTKIGIEENVTIFDEDFGTLDDICDLLNKQNKIIADLEAKLAESEKAFDTISAKYEKKSKQIFETIKCQEECSDAYNLLSKENEQLKHKIEESENFYKDLGFKDEKDARDYLIDCITQPKDLVEDVRKLKQQLAEKDSEAQSWKDGTMVVKLGKLEEQLAESEKFMQVNGFNTWKEAQEALNGKFECLFDEKHELWKKIVAENAQLKRQLAEKEKIEYTEAIKFVETSEPHIVAEELERLESEILDLEQSQTQTAIAELEKVKELIKNNIVGMGIPSQKHFISPIIDGIDQQIKSLKGEADE